MSTIRVLFSSPSSPLSHRPLTPPSSSCSSWPWKSRIRAVRCLVLDSRCCGVRCYAARRGRRWVGEEGPEVDGMENDAFYVVRKGDLVGIYKSLSDCQAQVGSSVCEPPVSVYKGYSLPKETQEYLASQGLENARYTINAVDCKDGLFGALVACPFKQPDAHDFCDEKLPERNSPQKRFKEVGEFSNHWDPVGPVCDSNLPSTKPIKQAQPAVAQAANSSLSAYILEFDGASKGNPGKAGAGVVVKEENGSTVALLREGLGTVTNNVAEYRALILAMKYALGKGFKKVYIQGDSQLAVRQVKGDWKVKHQNLIDLCEEAKQLKDKFASCNIMHVKREWNALADEQANKAVNLPSGEVEYEELAGMIQY